jgi:hypothetical protein
MGYPNPEQIPLKEDATFRGICVYVPNEPEYLRALLGSLAGLGSWVVWERDNQQSAAKSAELWRLANDKTLETWANDCSGGCMSFDCESMKDCLIEIAEAISVNVNVTVNNSCEGAGSGVTLYCVNEDGDITVNPPPVTDNPIMPVLPLPPDMSEPPVIDLDDPNPPDGFDTWEDYNLAACQAANALYDWAEKVLDTLIELLTERIYQITAVVVVIANLFIGGWSVIFSRGLIIKIAELYARLAINTDIFAAALIVARQNLLENRETYICQLYTNRGNVGDWENTLVTALFNASSGGMDDLNDKPLYLDLLRFALPGFASLGQVYASLTYNGPEDPFDCSACEASDIDITEDFSGMVDLTDRWTVVRVFLSGETASLNSTDVHSAQLIMLETDLENKWGGVPGLYENVIISFRWRATQVDDPTATFRLSGQQSPGTTSTLWQSVFGSPSDWRTVTLEPQTLNFTSASGAFLLEWRISGTSTRQIVEIDDIRITGDSS